jgi:hypothetical protein
MKLRTVTHYILTAALWTPTLVCMYLLSHNALLYWTFDPDYGILPEKRLAEQDIFWTISLYAHVIAGIPILLIPVISFLGRMLKISLRVHKLIGLWYCRIGLFLVLPTGIYLAFYAKGGTLTQIGFLVQALLFGLFTWLGWQAAEKGAIDRHRVWMTRGFAIMAAVLTFRVYHLIFFYLKVPYEDNYAISQWLSLAGNYFVAELAILWNYNKNVSNNRNLNYELKQ